MRCFTRGDVAHVYSDPDPVRDAAVVEAELLLADLAAAEAALERANRACKGGHKERRDEVEALARCVELLQAGRPLREGGLSVEARELLAPIRFLTLKPVLYLANTDETDPRGEGPLPRALAEAKGLERVLSVAVQIEREIAELPPGEAEAFLADLGIEEPGLHRVIRACYRMLDLVTFYTIANDKLRAWSVARGATAPRAAGKVHTDMERGFIRAEVMALADLAAYGGRAALLEKGLVHTVGRDYVVQDKDVLQFHFKA